jgi:uncharacterized protein (TIGR02265 family)
MGSSVGSSGLQQFTVDSEDWAVGISYTWDELRQRAAAAPADALVRGLFLSEIARLSAGVTPAPFVPFGQYSVREYMQLLVDTAHGLYPNDKPTRALFELGLGVYATFASTLAGLALFSATGSDFGRTVELGSRAYAMTLRPGEAHVVRSGPGFAEVQLRRVWAFPEILHCGIWLGAMRACNARGSIQVTALSDCDSDFSLSWRTGAVDTTV